MPRPRFDKLTKAQRKAILDVAAQEFAEHGFQGASFNRIIERAGISKGSMYYYFDDKADLYSAVLRHALTQLMEAVMPEPVDFASLDAAGFWREMRVLYVRTLEVFRSRPRTAKLARGSVQMASDPALASLRMEAEAWGMRWFAEVVAAGQAIGAVRTDLPLELLVGATFGIIQATDMWMLPQVDSLDEKRSEETADIVMDLLRRVLLP